LAGREKDIAFFKERQEKIAAGEPVKEIVLRSKKEAQDELQKKFGMAKTSAFRDALKKGEIKEAKE